MVRRKPHPQIRIRMALERQKHFQKPAAEDGMEFSEWIEDRLFLLADDKEGTASKIAEIVLAIWRICEVANGREISLQDPLASKCFTTIASIFSTNFNHTKNDVKRDADRISKAVKEYTSLNYSKILSIGSMLRTQNEVAR